jgi:alcohol dehydrogenase (cytochrome c)
LRLISANGETRNTARTCRKVGSRDTGRRPARGIIHAYDARSGAELWSHNNGLGQNGGIISYNAKGKQYVTVVVGWGSLVAGDLSKLYGEPYKSMPTDQGYLVTFALP